MPRCRQTYRGDSEEERKIRRENLAAFYEMLQSYESEAEKNYKRFLEEEARRTAKAEVPELQSLLDLREQIDRQLEEVATKERCVTDKCIEGMCHTWVFFLGLQLEDSFKNVCALRKKSVLQ